MIKSNEKYHPNLYFFIFFGCVTNRSFDNELKIKTPFNTKNIFPLLKVLREYELLEQDYFYYKEKRKAKILRIKKEILII